MVNDGPLRGYEDPANIPFMQAVGKGQCPRELEPEAGAYTRPLLSST
jgi:hypothetical protein